jgi:hypothetical protein
MSKMFDPDRVSRLAQISTKFHAHAAVGDTFYLGIEGDSEMPAKYRGARPHGVITKIKNEGSENSTIRGLLDDGRQVDLHPYTVDSSRLWEFDDAGWEKVYARANPKPAYRGSATDEVSSLRAQLAEVTQRFDKASAESKKMNNAMVEAIAQITNEISSTNKNAKFSKAFQEEYRGMSKGLEQSPFDSEMSDSD